MHSREVPSYECGEGKRFFVGSQIRKLSKDAQFLSTMTDVEKKTWLSFEEVVSKFLGNTKDSD